MTINEFIKRLAKKVKSRNVTAYWAGDMIRFEVRKKHHRELDHCPISLVAGTSPCRTFTMPMHEDPVPVLGLGQRRDRIVYAADIPSKSQLRRRLVKAAGLEE